LAAPPVFTARHPLFVIPHQAGIKLTATPVAAIIRPGFRFTPSGLRATADGARRHCRKSSDCNHPREKTMTTTLKSSETDAPRFEWRGTFTNMELNALHSECFAHAASSHDWWRQVNAFSLGWVCMRVSEELDGFVNVAWDGGIHAFLLDTMIRPAVRLNGYATSLVAHAAEHARNSGCEWLHVDFEPHLRGFYFDACRFRQTDAGLMRLE
jgi:GNAT superfamily N-acetyltransferase